MPFPLRRATIAAEGRINVRKTLLAAALAALIAPAVFAQSAKITVTQVAASGSGGSVTIDRKIEGIRESLVKKFAFSKYAFLSRKTVDVASGAAGTWDLANGNYLDIKFEGTEGQGENALHTLSLEIYKRTDEGRESISTIKYKRTRGQPLFMGVGKLSSGASLILVITAA